MRKISPKFITLLREHLDIGDAQLEDQVFPGTRKQKPLEGLIRT